MVFQKTPGMGLMEYDAYRGRQRLGRTFSIENPPSNNGVCMTAWQMNPRRVAASDAGEETGSEAFLMEAGGTSVRRELEVRPAGMH